MKNSLFDTLTKDDKMVLLAVLRHHPDGATEDQILNYVNNNKLFLFSEKELEDMILTAYGVIKEG